MTNQIKEYESTRRVDAIVIGAGISGLVSASILLDQGNHDILVVDTYDHIGGNHIDCNVNGYTFDVGSFIFQDDSPLMRHFPELLDRYQEIDPSWCKLNPQGVITAYPFSVRDDLIAAGPIEILLILLSVVRARLRSKPAHNAREFARYWIGDRLAHRSGLESYMERFCGMPADQIDLKFAEKRMLWISEYASLTNLATRWLKSQTSRKGGGPAPSTRTNRQLARPHEGFACLYAPAMARLAAGGVSFALGAKLQSIQRLERVDELHGGFRLDYDGQRVDAARVISTVPLDHILDLCSIPRIKTLPTVTLLSLFFSFSGIRGFDQSILYNFSHGGFWKRVTVYSDFYGAVSGREFFAVEIIAGEQPKSVAAAAEEFTSHCQVNGLFLGDLRLEGSHILPQAYPIYTAGAGDVADRAVSDLRAFGIESFGRQGAFQYQPTARVSTLEAEAALAKGRPA